MTVEQKKYLLETYDLSPQVLDRLLADVWGFTHQSPETWIQDRHSRLQAMGKRNEDIYQIIGQELPGERFAAPDYSPRQIRRIIYG